MGEFLAKLLSVTYEQERSNKDVNNIKELLLDRGSKGFRSLDVYGSDVDNVHTTAEHLRSLGLRATAYEDDLGEDVCSGIKINW